MCPWTLKVWVNIQSKNSLQIFFKDLSSINAWRFTWDQHFSDLKGTILKTINHRENTYTYIKSPWLKSTKPQFSKLPRGSECTYWPHKANSSIPTFYTEPRIYSFSPFFFSSFLYHKLKPVNLGYKIIQILLPLILPILSPITLYTWKYYKSNHPVYLKVL